MTKRVVDSKVLKLDFPEFQTISFSKAKLWRRCKMAFHYKYVQKLEKVKKGLPLLIGSAIHSCLEDQAEGRDPQISMDLFRKDFNKLFNEEKAELGDLPSELEGIMLNYFQTYKDDGLTYPVRSRGIRSEIPVQVDLDNHTRFIGYVDKFPQDHEGRNWVLDHKSCRSIPQESSRFADYQLVLYVRLLPELGYPKPDGVIWDYVRKKAPTVPEALKSGELSRAQKIDTTYEVYMDTVRKVLGPNKVSEYEEFAQTLKGREERFFRRIYLPSPNDEMVDTVLRDLINTAGEIRQLAPTSTIRSMTKDCSWCSYYTLCQVELRGMDSELIRKTDYQIKGETHDTEEEDPSTEE